MWLTKGLYRRNTIKNNVYWCYFKLFSEIFTDVSSNFSVKYLLTLVQLFSEIFTDVSSPFQ
jgi:hypothetical protein